jgi:hypothetical protein
MSFENLVAEIDAEISRLTQAKQLLTGGSVTPAKRGPGRPPVTASIAVKPAKKKRKMSAAGKARIAAAQKARWAKVNAAKAAKPAAKSAKAAKAK